MVDEMKKMMGRFEHLIGFKGTLDATSNESMKELIKAFTSKYKKDVQNSLRLHRLEFFYDLVERKKEDEVVKVEAKDIDDWKDLLTLSKIYYVLEHPRSEGLRWERYITKKKTIEKFTDIDLIEWRVSQNFRLRSLEEWAQRRANARRLAQESGFLVDDDFQECKDLEELFDSTAPKHQEVKKKDDARPFKFQDECLEDWTESYSDDSEYSDIEDFGEEIEDFPSELERKLSTVEELLEKDESISEMLATYPTFSQYRESVFEEMDEAKTFEEWFALYDKTRVLKTPKVEVEPDKKKLEEKDKAEEDKEKEKMLPKLMEESEDEVVTDDAKDSEVKEDKAIESGETSDEKKAIEEAADEKEAIEEISEEKEAVEEVVPDEKEVTEGATDEEEAVEEKVTREKEDMKEVKAIDEEEATEDKVSQEGTDDLSQEAEEENIANETGSVSESEEIPSEDLTSTADDDDVQESQ